MKKFMIFIVVLLVLLVGTVLILPKLIPLEKIKPQIQAQIKKQIGRDLLIEGDINISIWPSLSVKLQKVSLSNASWGRSKTFISLDEVDAELKLMPLLKKRIEIDRFVLHQPRIYLEVNKNGKGNWEFPTSSTDSKQESSNDKAVADSTNSITDDLIIKFGELKISDGVVNYEDMASNMKYVLDKIDISINATDMNSPIKIKGQAQYRARMMKLNFSADNLGSLVSMSPFKGDVVLDVEPFAKFALSGSFLETPDSYIAAKIDADISDINALMNWVSPTGTGDIPFKTLNLSSPKIAIGSGKNTPLSVSVPNLQMTLDDMNISGLLAFFAKNTGVPYVEASLSLKEPLDIPALLNKLDTSSNDGTNTVSTTTPELKSTNDWSDEKIDLSVLHAVNGKFSFSHNGLIYKDIKTGAGKAVAELSGGKLLFKIPTTKVDTGSILAKLLLFERGLNTEMQVSMQAKNIEIKTLLSSFADIDVMSGIGEVNFSAKALGQSQKALISTMTGKGNMSLSDGVIQGVDFVNIAQMLQRRLAKVGLGDKGTKFADFKASFLMNKGVVTNKDMHLIGPLVEAEGSGTINLTKQSMNYRVIPTVILNKSTNASVTTTTGLSVPVDIKGKWSNLKIKPDYQAALNNVLKDPKQFEKMGKTIKKDVKEQIKNFKNIERDLKNNPDKILQDIGNSKDMLKGLLGR